MRFVPFFIFLIHVVYASPEELEGSKRETVLSVLTAVGANDEGDRKLTCIKITGCQAYNTDTDCSCKTCSSTYTYVSPTKCCKTSSICTGYDPSTCYCTGCTDTLLYAVNSKGKCVCAPRTGYVLDPPPTCAVIGCTSKYAYLPDYKLCCKSVANCAKYDIDTCVCTGCNSPYVFKGGKCSTTPKPTSSPTSTPTLVQTDPPSDAPSTPAPVTTDSPTNSPSTPAPVTTDSPTAAPVETATPTSAPSTATPTASPTTLATATCPPGEFITSLEVEYGGAAQYISSMTCSGSAERILVSGFGAHVVATPPDPIAFPTNPGGYCSYSVGILKFGPPTIASAGLTLIGCDNVYSDTYGDGSTDVITAPLCPTGQKIVSMSASSVVWITDQGKVYPALMSQFAMTCGAVTEPTTPAPTSTATPTSAPVTTASPTNAPTATPTSGQACTADTPCICTTTSPCTGTQAPGVYICSGETCTTTSGVATCKHACENATFSFSTVTCMDNGCRNTHFDGCTVKGQYHYGLWNSVLTNSVITCDGGDGSCTNSSVSGGSVYCAVNNVCPNLTVTGTTTVTCVVAHSCNGSTYTGAGVTVNCLAFDSCYSTNFNSGACCSSGFCPTGTSCAPTTTPTSAPIATTTPTNAPTATDPPTNAPVATAAPTSASPTAAPVPACTTDVPCKCSMASPCTGTQALGVYICSGQACTTTSGVTTCKHACENATFSFSTVTCMDNGCKNSQFDNCTVKGQNQNGLADSAITNSDTTCDSGDGSCTNLTVSGNSLYCGSTNGCFTLFVKGTTSVTCAIDYACFGSTYTGAGVKVECVTLKSCGLTTFSSGACCVSGFCPDTTACGGVTGGPTPVPTPGVPTPTPQPTRLVHDPTPPPGPTATPTDAPTKAVPTAVPTAAPVQACTADTPCSCTMTSPCTGTQAPGVYVCSGQTCTTTSGVKTCNHACENATFSFSTVTCLNSGCDSSSFDNCTVKGQYQYGLLNSALTKSDTTCDGGTGSCQNLTVSGTSLYCGSNSSCLNLTVTGTTSVTCAADYACFGSTYDGAGVKVECPTTNSCNSTTFKNGACCLSGFCPTGTGCGVAPAPTVAAPSPTVKPTFKPTVQVTRPPV